MAKQHKLQYLSDAAISTMFLGNLPQSISAKLGEINDIIRTEQYLDFIRNRTFRSSLLCHNNLSINRNLKQEDIEKLNKKHLKYWEKKKKKQLRLLALMIFLN